MRFAWTESADDDGAVHFFILMDKCEESVATRLSITGDAFQEQELLAIAGQVCWWWGGAEEGLGGCVLCF